MLDIDEMGQKEIKEFLQTVGTIISKIPISTCLQPKV
jgi:hypothetical protein